MGHLRLLFLVLGMLSAAYLLLCLAAPTTLSFRMEGQCTEEGISERASGIGSWPFPLGAMEVEPLGSPGASRFAVNGPWGEHRFQVETRTETGSCVVQVEWESLRWPLLLRGAASLLNVRQRARAHVDGLFPRQSLQPVD